MSDPSPQESARKDWELTQPVFRRLLGWLDHGPDSEGQQYLEMRRRLVAYFDRKNCSGPDDLADETLNRVARRLEEEGHIEAETPARYCYIVARFVFMEYLRDKQKENTVQDNVRRAASGGSMSSGNIDGQENTKEKLLSCLEQCTQKLLPQDRNLILRYYIGKERAKIDNRRVLAEELVISMNALAIRACRIRNKLEACVTECTSNK